MFSIPNLHQEEEVKPKETLIDYSLVRSYTEPLTQKQLNAISRICCTLNIDFLEAPTKKNASEFIGRYMEESRKAQDDKWGGA